MTAVTPELIQRAYIALASGDRQEAVKYFSEDVRFLVPGRHREAGWRVGLDDLLAFRRALDEASGGSFTVELVTSMINEDHSMDVTAFHAVRAGAPEGSTSPYDVLDGTGMQVFRWQDGLVVEGKAGFFGDGVTNYDQWWSSLGADGERRYP